MGNQILSTLLRCQQTFLVFCVVALLFGCGGRPLSLRNSSNSAIPTSGDAALLIISEIDPFSYGSVSTQAFVEHTFLIENQGNSVASQIRVSGPTSTAYTLQSQNCTTNGAQLDVGSSDCQITIRFSPVEVGTFSDSFSLSYFDGFGQVTMTSHLTGMGDGSPVGHLSLVSGNTNYGTRNAGTPVDETFIMVSDGTVPVTGLTIGNAIPAGGNFSLKNVASLPNLTAPSCVGTVNLNVGASCFLVITYLPTTPSANAVAANTSSTLTLAFNNGKANANLVLTLVGISKASGPSVTITANNASGSVSAHFANASEIAWSSTDSTSCSLSADTNQVPSNLSQQNAVSGSFSIAHTFLTTTYTVSCSGSGGSTQASVKLTPTGQPNINGSWITGNTVIVASVSGISISYVVGGIPGYQGSFISANQITVSGNGVNYTGTIGPGANSIVWTPGPVVWVSTH